ncbi:MAG: hypothetical protein Q4F13_08910 [Pseudomonadota bacterium]|nr:hypothetical protein [Pseudomonadota bacterium]
MNKNKITLTQWRRRALRAEEELSRLRQTREHDAELEKIFARKDAARFCALNEIRAILDDLQQLESAP